MKRNSLFVLLFLCCLLALSCSGASGTKVTRSEWNDSFNRIITMRNVDSGANLIVGKDDEKTAKLPAAKGFSSEIEYSMDFDGDDFDSSGNDIVLVTPAWMIQYSKEFYDAYEKGEDLDDPEKAGAFVEWTDKDDVPGIENGIYYTNLTNTKTPWNKWTKDTMENSSYEQFMSLYTCLKDAYSEDDFSDGEYTVTLYAEFGTPDNVTFHTSNDTTETYQATEFAVRFDDEKNVRRIKMKDLEWSAVIDDLTLNFHFKFDMSIEWSDSLTSDIEVIEFKAENINTL